MRHCSPQGLAVPADPFLRRLRRVTMANRPTADAGRFRTVPERSPEFAHLALEGLRAYRRALTTEEGRVSYWRRIIQARLDLVRAPEAAAGTSTSDNLRGVFG